MADARRQKGVGQQAQTVQFEPQSGVADVGDAVHGSNYDRHARRRNPLIIWDNKKPGCLRAGFPVRPIHPAYDNPHVVRV